MRNRNASDTLNNNQNYRTGGSSSYKRKGFETCSKCTSRGHKAADYYSVTHAAIIRIIYYYNGVMNMNNILLFILRSGALLSSKELIIII